MIYISGILFILFIIHTIYLQKNRFEKLDSKFYKRIKIKEPITSILKTITLLANTSFCFIISCLLLIILRNKLAVVIVLGFIIDSCLIWIIKHIIKRPRPNIRPLIKEKGYSYVSGHSLTSTYFYGFLIFLVSLSPLSIFLKCLFIIFLVLLIPTIAFSRIYLGVHYLSDTIGGILLGSSYLFIYLYFTYFILNLF